MDRAALNLLLRAGLPLLSVLLWAGAAFAAPPASKTDHCMGCHKEMEGASPGPANDFPQDVHFQRGLSCVDCHGGDSTTDDPQRAKDPAKGFLGKPKRQDIPQFCARCHADPTFMRKYNPNLPTDQYAKYLTSQHGKRNGMGDKDVAVCVSCHHAHGIRSKKDPLSPVFPTNIPGTCAVCHNDASIMKRHKLPVTQFTEYAQSVHGQALLFRGDRAAPHCASCHGSHEAARPGVISIGNVCAQCHALTRDLFAKSPHKAAHDAMGLPECEVCHGNHLIRKPSDTMLGAGADAVCTGCHEEGSKGFSTARQMRAHIERLKSRLQQAKAIAAKAAELGMDASEAEYDLNEAATKLTQARTAIHSFSVQHVQPIVEEGIGRADEAKNKGQKAIDEYHFRRKGLWVTLAMIGLLIGALLLKIRDIERPKT